MPEGDCPPRTDCRLSALFDRSVAFGPKLPLKLVPVWHLNARTPSGIAKRQVALYPCSMTPEATFLSPERQAIIDRYERADRAAVGFSMDYPDGLSSGMHSHSKAQLVYAISGVMRVETEEASFLLLPTNALFLPADERHSIRMEGKVAMREVFIQRRVADAIASAPRILTVSPLLRELVLAMCAEPVDWPADGRSPHLVALIVDEIRRAKTLMTRLPQLQEPRLSRIAEALIANPADPRTLEDWAKISGASARTLARLFL